MPRQRHHYIPVFYLRQWVGSNGKLFRYRRDFHGKIVVEQRAPKNIGFEWDLYKMPGVSPATQNNIENLFMQQVDANAANLLRVMVKTNAVPPKDSLHRAVFTDFIISLIFRSPEEIAKMKKRILEDWYDENPVHQERYLTEVWTPGMPETLNEHLRENMPHVPEIAALEIATRLIQNPSGRNVIENMYWLVKDVSQAPRKLLTSDRPVVMTNGLVHAEAHIVFPLSPTKLFLAAAVPETIENVKSLSAKMIVREVNRAVIGQAVRQVYSVDADQGDRVKKYMSKRDHPSFI